MNRLGYATIVAMIGTMIGLWWYVIGPRVQGYARVLVFWISAVVVQLAIVLGMVAVANHARREGKDWAQRFVLSVWGAFGFLSVGLWVSGVSAMLFGGWIILLLGIGVGTVFVLFPPLNPFPAEDYVFPDY